MNGNKFNYYDINDGWRDYISNLTAEECQQLCIQDSSCLFEIYFFRNQLQYQNFFSLNIKHGALNSTCILRNQLKIQHGTQKDSSITIYYLIGIFNFV